MENAFDNAKITGNAMVSVNAKLYDDAQISDNAQMWDRATMWGCSKMLDNSKMFGDSILEDEATMSHNSTIKDKARMRDSSHTFENASLSDNAIMYDLAEMWHDAKISGNAKMYDNAIIKDKGVVCGNTVIKRDGVVGEQQIVGENNTVVVTDLTENLKESIRCQTQLVPFNGKIIAYTQIKYEDFNFNIGETLTSQDCCHLRFSNANHLNDVVDVSYSVFIVAEIKLEDIISVQLGEIKCSKAKIIGKYEVNENEDMEDNVDEFCEDNANSIMKLIQRTDIPEDLIVKYARYCIENKLEPREIKFCYNNLADFAKGYMKHKGIEVEGEHIKYFNFEEFGEDLLDTVKNKLDYIVLDGGEIYFIK